MTTIFAKVPAELNFPAEEGDILRFWKERKIFEKSLEERRGKPSFVFYEGPPTANGMPHNGHVLTRVIKDLFPRYKTMRGFSVPRKAGWDTHGLPVEVEVEKELHIHGKAAIEAYGVEPFVAKCIQSVFRYTSEWETLTDRVAFWCDLKDAYVTYHKEYVESVWWALSELLKKGLLYKGHKVVWWWAQGGTALSSAEVGLGYKSVEDPSVFVAFPLVAEPEVSLLVWTTTPWTLPSNMYAAVNPDFPYVVVKVESGEHAGRRFLVAKDLVPSIGKKLKSELTVERETTGASLVGQKYKPPFDLYARSPAAEEAPLAEKVFTVIPGGFVTLDVGTGLVHIAPAFGEDDMLAHRALYPSATVAPFCAIKPDGTFIPELTAYAGRWVKDADKDIQKELAGRGLLVHAEAYKHDYPFCWRADADPLIQYARPAWYIRTTREKDQAIANNRQVNWLPEHIKEGRMGDFLAHNVDWALSRERYWGTPLNLWINDVTGTIDAPPSVAAILERNPNAFDHFHAAKAKDPTLNEHLIVHKPWIDQVTWTKPGEEGVYRRVPEVIDAWFDSGCMPFAQWGYPHTEEGKEKFKTSFPADFISEAIDQTRGWFYSLQMVSTLLFGQSPYKTCIVLGHVSDKEGKKESKSKGNYTPPDVILDSVQMDFAVLDPNQVAALTGGKGGAAATLKPEEVNQGGGRALIAREDLEGLDLKEGAIVRLSRPDRPEVTFDLPVFPHKALKRRVVVIPEQARAALDSHSTTKPDVKPMDVPWLPPAERVTLRDPSSPAPGADAFRWFFYASNPPWNATRHSLSNVRALQKEFLVKLRNVFSFFTIYANIDGFDPSGESGKVLVPIAQRPELDRWILSELATTVADVTTDLDAYDVYAATGKLTSFVDALSNWYVRRSRDRFWRPLTDWTEHEDKKAAYQTLYEALVTLSQLIAPFVPYAAESMYRTLVAGPAEKGGTLVPESVHLTLYPAATPERIDRALSAKMRAVRELVSLGLQVRTEQKLKVRQPLAAAHVLVSDAGFSEEGAADVLSGAISMIEDELNVQKVHLVGFAHADDYVSFQLKPSFRALGQRGLGKEAQLLKTKMAALPPAEASALYAQLAGTGTITVEGITLGREDVEVQFVTKGDFAAAGGKVGMVILDTKIDDELRELGFVRELQNRIQTARKELGLEYVDRIRVGVVGSARVTEAVGRHGGALAAEVLALEVEAGHLPPGSVPREIEVDGEAITLGVVRVLVT